MNEQQLRGVIEDVRRGKLSRRAFTLRMIGLGLTAPLAAQMLASSGVAMAADAPAYKPTKRGGGGPLKMLWWQAPTLLNPHFAVGTKDQDASRIFYEPLAGWDADGNLMPVLAAEIPDRRERRPGGRRHVGHLEAQAGRQMARRQAVHRRRRASSTGNTPPIPPPRRRPSAATRTSRSRRSTTTRSASSSPSRRRSGPTPFVGVAGMIIPKHLFADYKGDKSRDAPTNLKPVGTGPYKFVDFKPGDLVQGEINPNYHMPNRPYFDTIEMKGGGDAVSAARAVLQTGEYDYAWNMQVEDEILQAPGSGRQGPGRDRSRAATSSTSSSTTPTPNTEVDGERSSIKTKHPFLSDPAVRKALRCWSTRRRCRNTSTAAPASPPPTSSTTPDKFVSKNTQCEFNIDKAERAARRGGLEAGRRRRPRQGRQEAASSSIQTSINAPRQKTQAIVKQACQKAGIDDRAEVGHRLGVLLVRRRQPRHLRALLLRPPDVHDDHDAARSRRVHAPVPVARGRHQGEQVAGPQHHALAERGIRQAARRERRPSSTRSSARRCSSR